MFKKNGAYGIIARCYKGKLVGVKMLNRELVKYISEKYSDEEYFERRKGKGKITFEP